jgi:hypothetical protein
VGPPVPVGSPVRSAASGFSLGAHCIALPAYESRSAWLPFSSRNWRPGGARPPAGLSPCAPTLLRPRALPSVSSVLRPGVRWQAPRRWNWAVAAVKERLPRHQAKAYNGIRPRHLLPRPKKAFRSWANNSLQPTPSPASRCFRFSFLSTAPPGGAAEA